MTNMKKFVNKHVDCEKSEELRSQVLNFWESKWSFSQIVKYFKNHGINISNGINISKGTMPNIKNDKENDRKKPNQRSNCGRKSKLNKQQFGELVKMAKNPNPKTQKEMAKKFNVIRQTISYQINKIINYKKVVKPKGHHLSS